MSSSKKKELSPSQIAMKEGKLPNTRQKHNTLEQDKIDQIIELRLKNTPIKDVSEIVGAHTETVKKYWKLYLITRWRERVEDHEASWQELLEQFQQQIGDANELFAASMEKQRYEAAAKALDAAGRATERMIRFGVAYDDAPRQQGAIAQAQSKNIVVAFNSACESARVTPQQKQELARVFAKVMSANTKDEPEIIDAEIVEDNGQD